MKFTIHGGKEIELIVVENHDATAVPCADYLTDFLNDFRNKRCTICFSTGGTPIPFYKELIHRYQNDGLSMAMVRAFLLDEYIGLPAGHPNCFRTFMEDNLYNHVDIQPDNIASYFGPIEDHMQNCFRYERDLNESGGADLMILGIGNNGHIAFNEPGTHKESRCRMIKLDESTRQANARFFTSIDEVPTHALSLGISNILEAKNILLIAAGQSKADAIKKALCEPANEVVPASLLQEFDGKMTVVLDQAAASGLDLPS